MGKSFTCSALLVSITVLLVLPPNGGAEPAPANPDLRVGTGFHAFEHLGSIGHQAEAAAQCGVTVIYASGVGGDGYSGLPAPEQWRTRLADEAAYARKARELGITTVLGYLCATSIIGLDTFDDHWTDEQRAEFGSAPETWLQQDVEGKPLPSWYGGAYTPACMNNPDWRTYEKYMVRQQLENGHNGIFFDNPTVHPDGCYCVHCMNGFGAFLEKEGVAVPDQSLDALRTEAKARVSDFRQYRCRIARDFLAEMRAYARSINPQALITANNSLNAVNVLYSQCARYAYNIYEMSKAEDFVVVEDSANQPRTKDDGTVVEYGPTYAQLHAIIHGRPLVAVTIVDGEYHTPPNLVRLAMAEAAANESMYMLWPAWPEAERQRMIEAVRPYADWERQHADLLNDASRRCDVQVFLPFRRWVETDTCAASELTAELSAARIQYGVFCEDDFALDRLRRSKVVLVENRTVLTDAERSILNEYASAGGTVLEATDSGWLDAVGKAVVHPSVTLDAPREVRVVVRDQPRRTIVHVMNLNIKRLDPFHDTVTPARDVRLGVSVPFSKINSVRYATPDADGVFAEVEHERASNPNGSLIRCTIPNVDISGILVVDGEA